MKNSWRLDSTVAVGAVAAAAHISAAAPLTKGKKVDAKIRTIERVLYGEVRQLVRISCGRDEVGGDDER